ncbi:MAG: hypothetical protein HZC41_03205 [Chloroflexi bacterium]|nr:hypothetical protein [Chloroflexota bacterium]
MKADSTETIMGINLTCPTCGQRLSFDLSTTTVTCNHCGYHRSTGLEKRAAEIRAKGQRPTISLTHQGEVNPRALALFNTGHDYLFLDNKAEAAQAFQRSLDIQADFLDAHLWLAKISDDELVKRDHLSTILAYNPGHMEATRLMMVLNGRLTPEQAARTFHHNEPVLQRVDGAVGTVTSVLKCPVCQGDLTVNDDTGRVECRFCGYTGQHPVYQTADGSDSLVAALLERKAQPVRWLVGERLLHCNECGAERPLPAEQLSIRCPFCGSNHVIEQDALDSFEQPSGIIPFRISRSQAGAAIKERLQGLSERLKGFFNNNKIARANLSGYYLPFWVFDAMVEVTRTRIDNKPSKDRARLVAAPYTQARFSDAQYDVEVCAVGSPPRALTNQLGDYHLRDMVDYAPERLAKYPAQLYSLDFDQAALEARGLVSTAMRIKYGQRELADDDVTINVFTNIQQMSFRLVLMPVWIATLVEEDRDIRTALVNGQTGKVVLGKPQKPGKA